MTGSEEGMMKKGPWTAREDAVLVEYVKKHGEGNWNAVQRNASGGGGGLRRCGKSCRLRWANHLRPHLKKGPFSVQEQRLIIHLHSKLGNKWARISQHLPGRTDNEIKNFWNTRVKRRIRQGLPLYLNQNPNDPSQSQTTKMPQLQPHLPLPLSSDKNPSNNYTDENTHNMLSLYNPIPPPPSSFFSLHHHPTFLPTSPFLTRCPTAFLGCPAPLPIQTGVFQVSPGQGGFGFGFNQGQLPRTTFDPEGFNFNNLGNFELPSNQIPQNMTGDQAMLHEMKVVDSDNPNVSRTKSGLLDDLLQESEIKVANHGLNSGNEVLPDILNLIPLPFEGSQSASVSIEDKLSEDTEPPVPVLSTSDYEDDGDVWDPSCYTWDNLPTIP